MQDITATKSKTWQAAQSLSDMDGEIFIGYQMQRIAIRAYQRDPQAEDQNLMSFGQFDSWGLDRSCEI